MKIAKLPFFRDTLYDSFSVEPIIWVRRGHESESGQMVFKQVKLTYFDAYLWQTMWNHAKKSMEESKHSDSVFLQWDCAENAKKTQKLEKLKRKLLKILKRYDLSRVVPCESWRPELSENVVVFEIWRSPPTSFQTTSDEKWRTGRWSPEGDGGVEEEELQFFSKRFISNFRSQCLVGCFSPVWEHPPTLSKMTGSQISTSCKKVKVNPLWRQSGGFYFRTELSDFN